MRQPLLISTIAGVLIAASGLAAVAQTAWTAFSEPRFGARLVYPPGLFEPLSPVEGDPDHYFQSPDGAARLVVGAWRNADRETPSAFRSRLLRQARERSLTYDPRGRSWFVLSGYSGDDIYYQKVMYSCGGRVVSAFGLSYPEAAREIYDPVVERMEDSFRPGRTCDG